MDVRMFTVGPVAENCFLFRRDGSDRALIVDPGDEAPKLLGAIEELGVDARRDPAHPHALRPRRRGGAAWPRRPAPRSGCRRSRSRCSPTSTTSYPWPGFGPFESWDAEHTVAGGERLELAGFEIDVIFTPGPQPRAT